MGHIIGLGFKAQLLLMVLSTTVCAALSLCSCALLTPHRESGDLLRVLLALGGLRPSIRLRQCLGLSPQPQLLQPQSVKFRDCSNPEETVLLGGSWEEEAGAVVPGSVIAS